jgi:hypothetical protein
VRERRREKRRSTRHDTGRVSIFCRATDAIRRSGTIICRLVRDHRFDTLLIKEADKMKTLKSCACALKTILHSWIGELSNAVHGSNVCTHCVRLGFTAFCQTNNSSVRLLVNCLLVQSEPMKVIRARLVRYVTFAVCVFVSSR